VVCSSTQALDRRTVLSCRQTPTYLHQTRRFLLNLTRCGDSLTPRQTRALNSAKSRQDHDMHVQPNSICRGQLAQRLSCGSNGAIEIDSPSIPERYRPASRQRRRPQATFSKKLRLAVNARGKTPDENHFLQRYGVLVLLCTSTFRSDQKARDSHYAQ
jgi:hypothetical protein